MIKLLSVIMGALLGLTGATAQAVNETPSTQPAASIAAAKQVEVDGAHVNVTALWNEARDGVGRYQAPAGYVIKSAVPRVQSESRSSSEVNISADKREVTLSVHARGSGNFLDKKRGWFQGFLHIVLEPQG